MEIVKCGKLCKHLCVIDRRERSSQGLDKRKMWGVHTHFQGSSLTSQALKTLKVMLFQRITYWKQSCMSRRCPHNFITALALCSTLNSVRKVKEVSGQSVAHLNWPTATCCSACSSPPHTERYCPLLTAAWHSSRNGALLSRFTSSMKMKMTGNDWWDFLCSH